jgi:hypothetical protein
MVYLAMAKDSREGGRDDVAALIAEAERWHKRALDVVPATSVHQREVVVTKFEESRASYGLVRHPHNRVVDRAEARRFPRARAYCW